MREETKKRIAAIKGAARDVKEESRKYGNWAKVDRDEMRFSYIGQPGIMGDHAEEYWYDSPSGGGVIFRFGSPVWMTVEDLHYFIFEILGVRFDQTEINKIIKNANVNSEEFWEYHENSTWKYE